MHFSQQLRKLLPTPNLATSLRWLEVPRSRESPLSPRTHLGIERVPEPGPRRHRRLRLQADIGKIESVSLPQRGTWVRQGQKIWSVVRDGKKVDMVAPIEGSVIGINEELVNNPELAAKDPYGEGWMVTVQSPDAKTNYR
jgi:hypothetical protein